MRKAWKEQTKSEKILRIARLAVSLVILCSAILKFLNIWPRGLYLAIPLFGVYYILETICSWKTDKDMAAFYLFMAVIVLGISCAVFFL